MTQEQFKKIRLSSFSDLSNEELNKFIDAGNEILAKGKTIDTEVMEIIDELLLELEKRG